MKLRSAFAAAIVVSLGLVPPPAATHRCDTEEPYCVSPASGMGPSEGRQVQGILATAR